MAPKLCTSHGGRARLTWPVGVLGWEELVRRPFLVKVAAAPLGQEAPAGRGSVQSAGFGHVSGARPARPALPGFKGPRSAKLPACPFWAPLSPSWPWHLGRRAPFPALASPTCPLAVRPPWRAARPEPLGGPLLAAPLALSSPGWSWGRNAFYFKYLMIGPRRAEPIFSVYHMWRANHGFWRLGGAGSPRRRRRGRPGDPAPECSRDGPGDGRLGLRRGRGAPPPSVHAHSPDLLKLTPGSAL